MSGSAEGKPRLAWWRRQERGFALIAVLWMLVLLAFLASSYSAGTRTGAYLTRNLEFSARAEALADAGIYRTLWELLRLDVDPRLRTDGTVYEWVFGEGRVRFSVHDEAGKVDLNAAPKELLERLFVAAGIDAPSARALAEAVSAFRDGEEEGGDSGGGLAPRPPDRFATQAQGFRTVDSVQQVLGMSAARFARIRPLITVYTGMTEPDVVVAPAAVRAAMAGLSADAAGPDPAFAAASPVPPTGEPAPEVDDDGPFRIVAGNESERPSEPPGGVAFRAEIVAIHAEARLPSGTVFVREAVADLRMAEDPYRFYLWRQARRQFFPVARLGHEP